ncbi:hypothetical protein [Mesorhizobium sp.]|uniref:hypothetical protein n=1 Tax=Mesorhizobium sp. TaxID=1871066 RepID=UPI00120BA938|nr:hypothetical protein [Mesorhizobium sp.]TIL67589.1 MAG: hypothetical protein E5Y77_10970 [Mesorhizobium sp.]
MPAMPTLISRDPLIGILELDTDPDPIDLAMHRKVAERLMSTVVEFLLPKEPTRRHLAVERLERAADGAAAEPKRGEEGRL